MTRMVGNEELEQLAAYYDATDLSAEIADAEPDDDVDPDPMITTSLRLPKSVLDQVRAVAADAGLRPTQLIRRWIEQAVTTGGPVPRHVDVMFPGGGDRTALVDLLATRLAETIELSQRRFQDSMHADLETLRELLERKQAS